jgi:hypothetical protein
MIISRDRQYLSWTNNPHHLEYMMRLDTECSRTRARERATDIQPVPSRVVFRTIMATETVVASTSHTSLPVVLLSPLLPFPEFLPISGLDTLCPNLPIEPEDS